MRSKSEPPRVRREVEHIAGLQIEGDLKTIVATIGDLLDNHLGHEFHSDELRSRVSAAGFRFRRLAGDPALAPAVEHVREEFLNAISPHLIAHTTIPRPESANAVSRVLGDDPPQIVFVHGSAGTGKSVVLYQVCRSLAEQNIPVLPIQLHTKRPKGSPDSFGQEKCGLPGSPALALRAIAGERRAVLILDQVDALRLTSVHSHEVWSAFRALVDDALADLNTVIIVACRSFDLENDPNISAWRRSLPQTKSADIRIGLLPDEVVDGILKRFGVTLTDLPARQQQLLKQPNTLGLWCALAESGQLRTDFDNTTNLMRLFIQLRRAEAVRDHGASAADIETVLIQLVEFLDQEGRLDAPGALCAGHAPAVDALCSVGLLNRTGAILSFVHQSYFDHLVAERILAEALRGGRDPAEWLKTNQSLFRRDQLRQLLTLLRESDPGRHEVLVRFILLSDEVRFHLKHLVLGLLRQGEPVLDHEARLILEISQDRQWWEHLLSSVLGGRAPWFDALDKQGVLTSWLAGEDEQRAREVLRFLRSVAEQRGEHIDRLLEPYWNAGGVWNDRLLEVLPFDPCEDSPGIAEVRLAKTRSGDIVFGDLFMDELAKKSPERLISSGEDIHAPS